MSRSNTIYGNCEVYSPQNELMFRCEEKRINWYLDRDLAVKIKDDPISIRLTFQPKGKGEKNEILKLDRKNICVVCGETDLSKLTKHHVVPQEYRKHFPEDIKSHSSIFVMPLCKDCHELYEAEFAQEIKRELEAQYGYVTDKNHDFHHADSYLKNILRLLDKNEIAVSNLITKATLNPYVIANFDVDLIYKRDKSYIKQCYTSIQEEKKWLKSPGEIIVSQIDDFYEFSLWWARHFVNSMKPQYLGEHFGKKDVDPIKIYEEYQYKDPE